MERDDLVEPRMQLAPSTSRCCMCPVCVCCCVLRVLVLVSGPGLLQFALQDLKTALIAMLQVYTHWLYGTVWYTTSVCVCLCGT